MSDSTRPPRAQPAVELADWHIGKLITAAARLVEHAFDAGIAELGVTHAGVGVLDALAQGSLTQRELATRCQVQDQTISRIVDGLERSGLVAREPHPGDRRRTLVRCTEDGAHVMKRVREVGAASLAELDAGTPDDDAACRRVLIKIIERYSGKRWGCPVPRSSSPPPAHAERTRG